jgi:hypothetical protein
MTGGWCLQLPVNAPDDTSKRDKRNVVSRDLKREVQLATKGGEID